jgi:hypothetical protein
MLSIYSGGVLYIGERYLRAVGEEGSLRKRMGGEEMVEYTAPYTQYKGDG